MHDYAWEPQTQDLLGTPKNFLVHSNLILLFSPVSTSLNCLSNFMDMESEQLVVDAFCDKFVHIFGSLKNVFVSRDIHFSWINVTYVMECGEEKVEKDQAFPNLGFLERGVKRLGWGFSSTDAITLGSALIPFGLIYPNIGCSLMCFNPNDCGKKYRAELSLEISDVSGKPLECKCCELELLDLKLLSRQRPFCISRVLESANSSSGSFDQGRTFWGDVGDLVKKIYVSEVRKNDDIVKIKDNLCHPFLIRGFSGEQRNDRKSDASGVIVADRVLEMLQTETSEFTPGKPIWQLFLTFLYRGSCSALVSVLNGDGLPLTGILKPFTVNSAFLYILDGGLSSHEFLRESDEVSSGLERSFSKKDNEIPNADAELDHLNRSANSQHEDLSSKKSSEFQDGKVKRSRKSLKLIQNLSWSSFCEAALRNIEMDLEDIYLAREGNNSKKFKFLKCWMKQIRKFCCQNRVQPNEQEQQHSGVKEEIEKRLIESEQESEQPVSSSFSTGEASLTVVSNMNEGATPACTEASETFFGSISEKIQQSLISEDVDLGALAERLVCSSIHWLYWKHEMDNTVENSNPEKQPKDGCGGSVVAELVKLLLREPKDLAAKYKACEPSALASDSSSAVYTSEYKVREYELQILFRMEILQSRVGVSIEETAKQKMVKQICSLLDIIPCHLAGGFFGDVSLDAYVKKNIKNRYSHSLGDVVHRIYTRMDLLLFEDDEGESPASLFNSEDSEEPQREKVDENEIGGNARRHASTLAVKSSQRQENYTKKNHRGTRKEEHKCSLMEARERRERDRRFRSFTSWVPDLQRVWAPKQIKTVRAKSECLLKVPKRNDRRGADDDVVCETPTSGNKRSCTRFNTGDEGETSNGMNFFGSVSKALFQDNGDSNPSSDS
ncbi:hypothetical protein BVC80_9079g25 [Macleaya cordata]|uniref:Treslin n=1 Tax=Macleaya cordata TaxID=56857 RepID=A0A200PUL0_MACCD|nr:hypothetical protein BVC80_9079g25 [Macleaya cordata]